MKIAVFRGYAGGVFLVESVDNDSERENFIGYLDIPTKKPKKMVTKEVENFYGGLQVGYERQLTYFMPVGGQNPKFTYEIEE